MKPTVLTLSLMLALNGCAGYKTYEHTVNINPNFLVYVAEFQLEGRARGVNTDIYDLILQFTSDFDTRTYGKCYMGAGVPLILINIELWPRLSDASREVLIFHELGHCFLGRPHLLTTITVNGEIIPTSIMYPALLDGVVYLNHRQYYVDELFRD